MFRTASLHQIGLRNSSSVSQLAAAIIFGQSKAAQVQEPGLCSMAPGMPLPPAGGRVAIAGAALPGTAISLLGACRKCMAKSA